MPKASEAWRRMDGCVCNGLLQALIFHFSHLTKQSQAAVVADFPALAADATITSYKKYKKFLGRAQITCTRGRASKRERVI